MSLRPWFLFTMVLIDLGNAGCRASSNLLTFPVLPSRPSVECTSLTPSFV